MSSSNHIQAGSTVSFTDTIVGVSESPQNSTFKHTPEDEEVPTFAPVIPSIIPLDTDDRARTLVLCFDGTGDQFDADNSNIVQFFTLLKKDDRSKQMVYYQAGIGTYTSPQVATPFMSKVSKTLDEAIAWNLNAHVMDGYEFLMQNYTAGDRICIFGFSRGAYTARALAGMLHKVGLLPACNHQQVPFAYKMFTRDDETGWAQSNAFKKAFSIDVDIEFVGVWDTVNSVGLFPRRLPFTTSNTIVRTFRHAVSLDERRAKFKANLWNRKENKDTSSQPDIGTTQVPDDTSLPSGSVSKAKDPKKPKLHRHASLKQLEKKHSHNHGKPTDSKEVWFAGCHCDVGGGSVPNDTPHSLARIPLRWMIRECFKTETGILFDSQGLKEIGLDPASVYPVVQPRPPQLPLGNLKLLDIPDSNFLAQAAKDKSHTNYAGLDDEEPPVLTEEEHDLHDLVAPIYDQLSLVWWFWWFLELLPMKQKYQKYGEAGWQSDFGWNLGRGRHIPGQATKGKGRPVRVHRTVKTRLEAEDARGNKYQPKAHFDLERVIWED